MNIENVKGIVWDLDGTLLDSFGIFEQIIADVVEESGHEMPSNEFMLANYHGSLEETVQRILGIDSATDLDEVVTSFLKKQERHYGGDLETHLLKDASMLAQKAAKLGIHQLLVTDRAHEGRGSASPRFIIAATVLADCIQDVYPGDEVDFRKPDARSIGDWMHRYELLPAEILVIGDQYVDAKLALNIGARAILVKRNGDMPHIGSLAITNPAEVMLVSDLDEIEIVQ